MICKLLRLIWHGISMVDMTGMEGMTGMERSSLMPTRTITQAHIILHPSLSFLKKTVINLRDSLCEGPIPLKVHRRECHLHPTKCLHISDILMRIPRKVQSIKPDVLLDDKRR